LRDGLKEGGFFVAPWCGNEACEEKVSTETTATIRVLPLETEDPGGPCVVCGEPGSERATWAKAY
jgi:prolyl-tRNA synthetase